MVPTSSAALDFAQCLGVDEMGALGGVRSHLLDVFLNKGALSEVSLDLSGYAGAPIERGPDQGRVELRRHRDGRLYHTPAIPGYSHKVAAAPPRLASS